MNQLNSQITISLNQLLETVSGLTNTVNNYLDTILVNNNKSQLNQDEIDSLNQNIANLNVLVEELSNSSSISNSISTQGEIIQSINQSVDSIVDYLSRYDEDADGIADYLDACPNSDIDAIVNSDGCLLNPTIIAEEGLSVGDSMTFEGSTYILVDTSSLKEMVDNNQDLSFVVTSLVTDMEYLFYQKDDSR